MYLILLYCLFPVSRLTLPGISVKCHLYGLLLCILFMNHLKYIFIIVTVSTCKNMCSTQVKSVFRLTMTNVLVSDNGTFPAFTSGNQIKILIPSCFFSSINVLLQIFVYDTGESFVSSTINVKHHQWE